MKIVTVHYILERNYLVKSDTMDDEYGTNEVP